MNGAEKPADVEAAVEIAERRAPRHQHDAAVPDRLEFGLPTPKRFDALLVGHLASAASALDLAVALHEIVPDVPILLATASADESGAEGLLAAGIFEIVCSRKRRNAAA